MFCCSDYSFSLFQSSNGLKNPHSSYHLMGLEQVCNNWCKNVSLYVQVYASSLRSIITSQVSSHKEKCVDY